MPSASPPALGPVLVRRERRDEGLVAHVVINNDRKLNALDTANMTAFVAAMAALSSEPDLRVVVVTGAGDRAFAGGADIAEMGAITVPEQARAFITRVHDCCAAIRDCPVPVIGRVNGYAFGGGLELAAACDLRVAADSALFGMQEVRLGIPSVVEAALFPGLMGWGRAREMLLLGETFGAADALRFGLVERVVPAADLDAAVEDWVGKVLAGKPRALRLQKQLMRRWEDLPLREAIAAGIDSFADAFTTDEPRKAMAHFFAEQAARKRAIKS